jgi:tripartite-type tricarboxylate transporter receptor subunit TctC
LAISGAERIASLPDVPTMTEFGSTLDVNGQIGSSWHGIFAPRGTPDDIIAKLNTEIVKIVKMPEIQSRMRDLGLTPTGTSAEALSTVAASDYAFWGKIVKDFDIKVE